MTHRDITPQLGIYNTNAEGNPFKWAVSFRDGTEEVVYANDKRHAMMMARWKREALAPGIRHQPVGAVRIN